MASFPGPAVVVVTAAGKAAFTGDQVDRLQRSGETTFAQATGPISAEVLGELLDGAAVAGLTPRAVPRLGPEEIAALPTSLRGIAVFATGVDFVDVTTLRERGIALRGLPGYSTTTVAEHTIALLLVMARRLHLSRDRALGRVSADTSLRGWEVCGKTLGVVGLGRIGRRVAELAEALGMRVIGTDTSTDASTDVGSGTSPAIPVCSFDELLATADVVSLHTSTYWQGGPLLGAAELTRLKPLAHLINASRAKLVDERAVVAAIASGRLAGYAVDDRLSDRVRPQAAQLLREGRIVESDHTAWYSQEALDRGTDAWVDAIAGLAGAQIGRGQRS